VHPDAETAHSGIAHSHAVQAVRSKKIGCRSRKPSPMYGRERRRVEASEAAALRAGLTPARLKAPETLEHFRWTLEFVRRPMFQDPVPVVFDRTGKRYAVLEPDGRLNENSGLRIRD
jgi:hypothetical protein